MGDLKKLRRMMDRLEPKLDELGVEIEGPQEPEYALKRWIVCLGVIRAYFEALQEAFEGA